MMDGQNDRSVIGERIHGWWAVISRLAAVGIVLVSVAVAPQPAGAVAGFGDVLPGRFYTEAVQWMVDNDVTNGVSPTCFATSRATTRGESAAFVWRMEGRPDPGPAHGFTDVAQSWQQDPVSWMSNNSITFGSTATTFSPDRVVTRGEFAAFLYRLAGEPDPGPAHGFIDVADGRYYTDAVLWMANEGITKGTSATTFSPERLLTRGEAATFLYRYKDQPTVTVAPASPACVPWHRGRINATPADAVQEFVDFIGFSNPTIGEFRQGDSRSGEIEISTPPPSTGPTTAFVRLDSTDNWVVIGAASDAIEVTEPAPDATVSSPVLTVFDHANWALGVVQIWPDGSDTPVQLGGLSPGRSIVSVDVPPGVSGPATLVYRSEPLTGGTLAATTLRVTITP